MPGRLGRWRSGRLGRVQLRATPEVTPPISGAAVRPYARRLVLSDLHMGAGDRLEEFTADDELAAFVQRYAAGDEPTELILGGDTFEFLQALPPGVGDYEWTPAAAELRLAMILAAHPRPIAALRRLVAQPGCQLTVLIGNHDFELHYGSVKRALRQALGLGEGDERLRFGSSYEGEGVYLVHGNQFDPWNRFVHPEGIAEPFEVVRGTRVVKDVINQLKAEPLPIAPLMDNVKPLSALVWHLLSLPSLRDPAVRSFVLRGVMMFARSVARVPAYAPPAAPLHEAARDGSWRVLRRRGARGLAQVRSVTRRVVRSGAAGDDAVTQIEREAGQRLRREIRVFRGDTLRAMARIARSPVHHHNTLFVCGHTHLAQVVPLSGRQTYINTGTWTEVVLDVARGRRQEQRFPFLEITSGGGAEPRAQLLVWRGADQPPQPWVDEHADS